MDMLSKKRSVTGARFSKIYPKPIVDLKIPCETVLAAFQQLREVS